MKKNKDKLIITLILLSILAVLLMDFLSLFQIRFKADFPKTIYITTSPTPTTPSPTEIPQIRTITESPVSQPLPTLIIFTQPTKIPVSYLGGEQALLNQVNNYRRSLGLSDVKADPNTCSFAEKRAQEISANFSHDGFKNYPYPTYSRVSENIAQNSDYNNVIQSWIDSSSHSEILRQDILFACIQRFNEYYVYEGWKP